MMGAYCKLQLKGGALIERKALKGVGGNSKSFPLNV